MATRAPTTRRRLRKRKAPDTPPQAPHTSTHDDSATYKEPEPKRRRITHYRRPTRSSATTTTTHNNSNSKVEKSHSVEPRNLDKAQSHEQTRYEEQDDDDDDERDDARESSESSSPEPSVGESFPTGMRSQPSTPVRMTWPTQQQQQQQDAHHSQSAKRSRTKQRQQEQQRGTSNRAARNLYLAPTMTVCSEHAECTPPPPPQFCASERKHTPNLHQSQDSIDFSPSPSPKRNHHHHNMTSPAGLGLTYPAYAYPSPPKLYRTYTQCQPLTMPVTIPINSTPLRDTRVLSSDEGVEAEGNTSLSNRSLSIKSGNIWQSWSSKNARELWDMLVFILLGVVIGVIVSCSVMQPGKQPAMNPTQATHANFADIASLCACDVKKNRSSLLCHPCMDQYRDLERDYEHCVAQSARLMDAEKYRTQQHALMVTEKCDQMRDGISGKYDACRIENAALRLRDVTDGECRNLKYEVLALKHDLGECHVEWGTCQQSGRQKDKLDELRLQEIEKQKRKFSLCNEQLKRLKNKAKTKPE